MLREKPFCAIVIAATIALWLSGCASEPISNNNASRVLPQTVDLSAALEGVTYHYQPVKTDSTVPFLIVYEENSAFHVPWFIGDYASSAGLKLRENSEILYVDPVQKTVSLAFDNTRQQVRDCPEGSEPRDRAVVGYSLCTSRLVSLTPPTVKADTATQGSLYELLFSSPKTVNKSTPMLQADIDASGLATVVRQLNLLSRAEDVLTAEVTTTLSSTDIGDFVKRLQLKQKTYERKLLEIQQQYLGYYRKQALKPLAINRSVSDRSGYFGYEIEWMDAVSRVPRSYTIQHFDYSALLKPLEGQEMNDAVASLANVVSRRLEQQFEEDERLLKSAMAQQLSHYKVVCEQPDFMGQYQISLKCPASIGAHESEIKVHYEILTRQFGVTLPGYGMHNADISVQSNSQRVGITNNSRKNIWIKQLELLGNSQAQVLYGQTGVESGYLLKPAQTLELDIRSKLSESMQTALFVAHINRREAARKKMMYGYRLNYQVEGASQAQQISEVRDYRLDHVLLSRY
jgi:hypothetical protein